MPMPTAAEMDDGANDDIDNARGACVAGRNGTLYIMCHFPAYWPTVHGGQERINDTHFHAT